MTTPPRPRTAERLAPFGTTIFTEMTALALRHNAVNLSQGFPDFDGPEFIKSAAADAIRRGENQYARMLGLPALNRALAQRWGSATGHDLDPDANVTITSGCTEALAAAFLGLLNPGDEVVLFEPFYDSYRACAALAGATPRFVTLTPPSPAGGGAERSEAERALSPSSPPTLDHSSTIALAPSARVAQDSGSPAASLLGPATYSFSPSDLRAAFTPRTRAILVNTPHNPTGKVFTREELQLIADLCIQHDAVAITDEVYESLTFNPGRPHTHLATLPGMAERTLTLSSLGKTFSLTGWKIGWAIGPADLVKAVRSAHQFLTFATATPLQHGAAAALTSPERDPYIASLLDQYRGARDFLASSLEDIGFRVYTPDGTYFIMADHTPFGFADDVAFCRHLASEIGVAAIPPSAFYSAPERGRSLVRFAFCKKPQTLEAAVARLQRLKR